MCSARKFASILSNQQGIGLAEILIVSGLIAALALIVGQFNLFFTSKNITHKRSCEQLARSIIGVVQEETYFRAIVNFQPIGANRTANNQFNFAPLNTQPVRAVPAEATFWSTGNFNIASENAGNRDQGGLLNNSHLIAGSLRSLTTIFNQTPAVRCAYGTYDPLTNINNITGALNLGSNFTNNIQNVNLGLFPYRITDNTAICANPIFVRPWGASPNDVTINATVANSARTSVAPFTHYPGYFNFNVDFASPLVANFITDSILNVLNAGANDEIPPGGGPRIATFGITPATGTTDLGVDMRVRIAYNYNGQAFSCEASQKFEYPRDREQPPAPNVIQIVSNNSLDGVDPENTAANCVAPLAAAAAQRSITVQIGYAGGVNMERGSQLLCKDLSYTELYQNNNEVPLNVPTDNGASNPNRNVLCSFPPGGGATLQDQDIVAGNSLHYFSPRTDLANLSNNGRVPGWQPCDQLTQCGVQPAAYNPALPPAPNFNPQMVLQMTYSNLPPGCRMMFEAVSVDTAGNRSVASTANFLVTNPVNYFQTLVHRPTCGNDRSCGTVACRANQNNPGFQYGYYIVRQGVFCKPTTNEADDANLAALDNADNSSATLHWGDNTAGLDPGTTGEWRRRYPNGYYTCRGAAGFAATGGAGGSGPNGCCWDAPGSSTCTPFN